jgi:hypothetical protein
LGIIYEFKTIILPQIKIFYKKASYLIFELFNWRFTFLANSEFVT